MPQAGRCPGGVGTLIGNGVRGGIAAGAATAAPAQAFDAPNAGYSWNVAVMPKVRGLKV